MVVNMGLLPERRSDPTGSAVVPGTSIGRRRSDGPDRNEAISDTTWNDGELTEDDVIESADGTGYLSTSEFVAGEDGFAPDATYDIYDDAADDTDTDGY